MVKFSDMPYERADLEAAGRELKALAKALCDAKSGEEQFEIHQKYYALKAGQKQWLHWLRSGMISM